MPGHDEPRNLQPEPAPGTELDHTALASGEFFGRLIHDLRDLLGPVGNAAQLARLQAASAPQFLPVAEIMERQIGRLCRLLEKLAIADKVFRADAEIRCASVALDEVIDAAMRHAKPEIDARRLDVRIERPPPGTVVHASASHLVMVIAELLDNAVGHSVESSRLWLDARLAGGVAMLSIRDEGVGIPAERMAALFEPGTERRGPGGSTRKRPGLGIGLACAQRIMALTGGRIEAASPGLGGGCMFTVQVPLTGAREPLREPLLPRDAADAPSTGPCRVLIVDDNRALQRSLAALIEELGGVAKAASDGLEAIELAQRWRPDLVMIDIHLPKLNGFAVARRLRAVGNLRALRLVLMSSVEFNATLQDEARAAGIDRCVPKLETGEFLREVLPKGAPAAQ